MEDDNKEIFDTTLSLGLGSSRSETTAKKKEATMVSPSSSSPATTTSHHSDTNGGETTAKKRKFTADQLNVLEHTFNRQKTIDQAQKEELAERLNLGTRQVEIWFQNRRARQKQQETGKENEMLKEKYESVLAENIQLKQERQELMKHLMAITVAGGATTGSILHTQFCPNCGYTNNNNQNNPNGSYL